MSKEVIRSSQFARAQRMYEELEPADQLRQELHDVYLTVAAPFRQGKIVKGTIVSVSSDGILVDINYKSDGLIPRYEFSEGELKKLVPGGEIEVILDEL
jgi:small subunit ribosomal protein S1